MLDVRLPLSPLAMASNLVSIRSSFSMVTTTQ